MIFANLICRMQHRMFASFTVIMSPTSLQMHAGSWRWGWSDRKDIFPGPVLLLFYEYLQFMHIVRNDLNKMALAIITSPLSVVAISSEW